MKVLVTGSAGKLGTATVAKLNAAGNVVFGADLIPGATTHIILDIRDDRAVSAAVKGFDAIIHTAALHGRHCDLNFPRSAFIDTNINGSLNLLNASVEHGLKKFLYISTTSIYGNSMVDLDKAVWVDELLIEQPRDIYDITKQTAEQLCRDFFRKEGLQTSVYRVARFLPEEDNLKINHRLYRGLDERDGAEALNLALEHTFGQFETFNIASTSPFSKDDLVTLKDNPIEVILKLYPTAADTYKLKGWSFPKSIDRVYIIDKARSILGFNPKYTFDYLLQEVAR
jgi:nucleoside-diphosphate-sugar epimerase